MENFNNLISIVIPYHGRLELFKETLNSLKVQTYKNFEVVISDDSEETESSLVQELLSEYKDLNINYVRTLSNLGAIQNTIQGIKFAKNKYIHILHSDDILAPECLNLEYNIISEHPEIIFITHFQRPFTTIFIPAEDNNYSIISPDEILREQIFFETSVPSCWIFKKELLEKVALGNDNFSFCYDWNFLFEVLLYLHSSKQPLITIPAGYVGWRMHECSETSNGALKCYEEWGRLINKICNQLKNKNILSNKKLRKLYKKSYKNREKRLIDDYKKYSNFKLPFKVKVKYLYKKVLHFLYSKKKEKNKNIYIVCGIKIAIRKHQAELPAKYIIEKVINCKKVPVKFDNNFYVFKHFPVSSDNVNIYSETFQGNNIGIVIQGPVKKEDNFTLETLKIYKKNFNNGEKLILSTWENEDKSIIDDIKNNGIYVVQSQTPVECGRGNINFQIISTQNGIKKADELGCQYILKTRTDQRMYAANISRYLINLLKLFPVNNEKLNSRIIALSFNSFIYRFYGVSDMFQFGNIQDIKKYWNIPLDKFDPKILQNISFLEYFKKYSSETYIVTNFLRNIGKKPVFTIEDSLSIYRDIFLFIDKEQIDFYWPKYTNKDSRWRIFEKNIYTEISFNSWLTLYLGQCNKPIDKNLYVPELEEL